jgi:hypothetical protein
MDNEIEQTEAEPTNLERLQAHLKKDSLAEKLVTARIAAGNAEPLPGMRKVVLDRVEELKRKHESVPDQKT